MRMPPIRNPLSAKNSSTPMKPPKRRDSAQGMADRRKKRPWLSSTSRIASARQRSSQSFLRATVIYVRHSGALACGSIRTGMQFSPLQSSHRDEFRPVHPNEQGMDTSTVTIHIVIRDGIGRKGSVSHRRGRRATTRRQRIDSSLRGAQRRSIRLHMGFIPSWIGVLQCNPEMPD